MSVGGDDSGVIADINVTPMVDVMLVLLIIFMVVTPAIVAGFQAQLPEGVHLKPRPEEDARTVLGIDLEGAYYINKKPVPSCSAVNRKANPDACRQAMLTSLTAEFASHPEDKVLFVKADKRLKYKELIEAMDLGRDSGARVMAAVSEQRPGTQSAVD